MLSLIIAGVPTSKFLKFDPPNVPGWNVTVIDSKKQLDAGLNRCWNQVLDVMEALDARQDSKGVHLLVFHTSERDYPIYAQQVNDHHRIRLLPLELVQLYGKERFGDNIRRYVAVEEDWRAQLLPKDYREPAILPEPFFKAASPYNMVWERIRDYNGTQEVQHIKSLVKDFKTRYHFSRGVATGFKDTNDFFFASNGARHGEAPSKMRNWKYGVRLPDRFHYDLTSEDRDPFVYTCRGQNAKRYTTHCNIDAFGYERASATLFSRR